MNPFLTVILQSLLPVVESVIAQEGATAVAWITAELAKLEAKYGLTPTLPVVTGEAQTTPTPTPTPH